MILYRPNWWHLSYVTFNEEISNLKFKRYFYILMTVVWEQVLILKMAYSWKIVVPRIWQLCQYSSQVPMILVNENPIAISSACVIYCDTYSTECWSNHFFRINSVSFIMVQKMTNYYDTLRLSIISFIN